MHPTAPAPLGSRCLQPHKLPGEAGGELQQPHTSGPCASPRAIRTPPHNPAPISQTPPPADSEPIRRAGEARRQDRDREAEAVTVQHDTWGTTASLCQPRCQAHTQDPEAAAGGGGRNRPFWVPPKGAEAVDPGPHPENPWRCVPRSFQWPPDPTALWGECSWAPPYTPKSGSWGLSSARGQRGCSGDQHGSALGKENRFRPFSQSNPRSHSAWYPKPSREGRRNGLCLPFP